MPSVDASLMPCRIRGAISGRMINGRSDTAGPAQTRKHVKSLGGNGGRLGGIGDQQVSRISGEQHALVREFEISGEGVMDSLAAVEFLSDAVVGPGRAELRALDAEFSDERGQARIVREWSLFSRDIENRVVPAAAELGVALVPYSPLGRGILAGALAAASTLDADDVRRNLLRFAENNDDANRRLLDPLRAVAASRQATLAQIALAWLHR